MFAGSSCGAVSWPRSSRHPAPKKPTPPDPNTTQDGLLLDTETHYTTAQEKVLQPLGVQFTFELKSLMMGKRALEAAEALIAATGLEGKITPQAFVEAREEILDKLFPTSELMPGVEKLVTHLHAQKIPMAVATSSHRRHFDAKTQRHGPLFGRFAHVTTGDQVQRGKPHPDIFEKAAGLFADPPERPEHVLVFEDAPSGVGRPGRQGCAWCWFPTRGCRRSSARARARC